MLHDRKEVPKEIDVLGKTRVGFLPDACGNKDGYCKADSDSFLDKQIPSTQHCCCDLTL